MPSDGNGRRAATLLRLRPALFVAHVAATCALGLLLVLYGLTPEPARIEIDLSVSGGTSIELFLNDLTRRPLTQRLVLGQRRQYVFDGIAEDITLLRIDPTNENGATVDIYSVVVKGREGVLAQFGPQALAGWTSSALTTIGLDGTALRLRSTTDDPVLVTRTAIPVQKGGRWAKWLPLVNVPDISWRVAAASLILLLLSAAVDPARRLHVPTAVAAAAWTWAIVALVGRMPDAPGAADVAVSRATFMGLSLRPAVMVSVALLAGSAVMGALAALLRRRRVHQSEDEGTTTIAMGRRGIVWGLVVIVALTAPGLETLVAGTATRQFGPHWDSDNVTFWAYRVHTGGLPFRDFWYPYGGAFTFDLPLLTGPVIRWLYNVALFGTFFVAMGRWCGAGAATLATALLFAGQRFGTFPGIERYLLGPTLVVAYVAVGRSAGFATRLPFWIACAAAMFLEPPQLLYAAFPIGLILATDAVESWRSDPAWRRWLTRRVVADFGVPVVVAVITCVVLAISGQIGGVFQFYWRLGDIVAYGAWPGGLPAFSLMVKDQHELFLLSLAAVLVAVGTCEWITGGPARRYGQAVAGMGVVVLMVMQKAFTRWMGDSMLVTVFAGIVVLALGWPGRRRMIDHVVAGLILGTIGATLVAKPDATSVLATVSGSFGRALSDVRLLLTGADAVDEANRVRFAPERLARYPAERQVVDRLRAHAGPAGDVRVFAVTDNPILYVLTGQPRVWMANLYNGSPVSEQTRMVRWLQSENPPYAVLNRDRLMLDGFQLVVRNPLVFAEAVDRYVPFDSIERIDLLQRRVSGEPVALAYWRDRLGADVNVGRVASVSSFSRAATCESRCADLLDVGIAGAGAGSVQIPIRVADLAFSVTFTRVPDEAAYRVLLDRVWFWRAAQRSNLPRSLGESQNASVRPRIRQVPIDEGVLY